jgi:alkylation response protein AidB-like acyl-CoA dehydrogenase
MEFALTPEQEKFAQEFRDYLKKHVTPDIRAAINSGTSSPGGEKAPVYRDFIRRMGHDGWLGVGWPKEYGGQGRTPMEQHLFFEITEYENITLPLMALNAVGPTLMRVGSEELKKELLPAILRGELEIAVGYTEPEAGTDLASLKTKAVKDGDEYIINGQKVFTSGAHFSDYLWLAARTDHEAPKHRGISVFLIPMSTPGITIEPIYLMDGERNNATFYDNVRVPKKYLVGEENKGWKYITGQLDLERVALSPSSGMKRSINEIIEWAKETNNNGSLVIEKPWVRAKLAELTMKVEVLKMLNYRIAWMLNEGIQLHAEASMVKSYGTVLAVEVANELSQILGLYGQVQKGSKWAILQGAVEHECRRRVINLFGGGALEIQKNIIATVGLGMPRSF